jgi:hypothetical protein
LTGLAIAGIHLALIGIPGVNLEYAFVAGTRYLTGGKTEDLELFQHYQANTFGVPLVALALQKTAPFFDWNVYLRMASILGIPIFAVATYGVARALGLQGGRLSCAIALCLLNPFIWVFSGRGTADFLPAAVGMAGLWILWTYSGLRATVLAGLTLGLAIVLKYHAFVFAVVAVVYQLLHSSESLGDRLKRALRLSLVVVLIPATYLISVDLMLGYWLTPERHQQALGFNAADSIGTFSQYATYMVMLTLPFSVVFSVKEWSSVRHGRWLVPATVLATSLVCGYFIAPGEEMSFGPLNRIFSRDLLTSTAIGGGVLLGYILVRLHALSPADTTGERVRAMVYGITLFLLALSFTRPANRYLIMILPLGYLLLLRSLPERPVIIAAFLTFPALVGLNAYFTCYQIATGRAASELAARIDASQLLPVTDPGAVEMHAGDRFFSYLHHPKKYTVLEGRPPNAVMTVEEKCFGGLVRRSYSVVPNTSP